MNKNTLFAFLLIFATIIFFNSPVWYKTVLQQPYPYAPKKTEQIQEPSKTQTSRTISTPAAITTSSAAAPVLTPVVNDLETLEQVSTPVGSDTIWVKGKKLHIAICSRGGRIVSAITPQYRYNYNTHKNDPDNHQPIQVIADKGVGGSNLSINDQSYDSVLFTFDTVALAGKLSFGRVIELDSLDTITVNLTAIISGLPLKRSYTIAGNSYRIGSSVESPALPGKSVTMGWNGGIRESEENDNPQNEYIYDKKAHVFDGKGVEKYHFKKIVTEDKTGQFQWVGITSKYFLIALANDSITDADCKIRTWVDTVKTYETKKETGRYNYAIQYRINCDETIYKTWLYIGPNQLSQLAGFNIKLEKVLFGGWEWLIRADIWFAVICEWVLWFLIFLNNLCHDYGIAIILLTIVSRIITYPLTASSMKSMGRMKDLQPKITALRDKHKNNPKKMNEMLMQMYKEEGVNPLNPGCLPMFLQMPVFIALFIVLQKAIELRGATTILIPWVKDLSQPEVLIPLTSIFPGGIPLYGNNIALLPILMAITQFFQSKMTIKDPSQKFMIYFMPIFMLVLFNNFATGIVLYWTFSNLLAVIQQIYTDKQNAKRVAIKNAHEAAQVKVVHRKKR